MNFLSECAIVPAITVAVYSLIEILKNALSAKQNERFMRWIPIISLLSGGIISVIVFYAFPSVIPTQNLAVAIVYGFASGLAATGTNQIAKQMLKFKEDNAAGGQGNSADK